MRDPSRLEKIRYCHRFFGISGLYVTARAKFTKVPVQSAVSVAGIKHPIYLRFGTSDADTFVQIFISREYDFEPSKPPNTIIDAGANIGLASIYFSNKFPDAKIISVEPEESNFSLLKKNVRPYPNVFPVQAALWENNCMICVTDPGQNKWGFQVEDQASVDPDQRLGMVQAITVDKMMRDNNLGRVDILKIDIEGAEKEVFKNASKWIDKVDVLIVELHDRLKMGCSRSFYNATNDFDLEWHRGEHVFLARTQRA